MVEVTRDGDVVFDWKGTQGEVNSVQKVAGGNYVITEAGPKPRLLEINAEGKTVVEIPLACQKPNVHMQMRMARKLASGNYLCPHLLDFAVKQYDSAGKVVREIKTDTRGRKIHDWPFTAIRLENGNTLIGCTHGNRMIEVDADGKIVWEVTDNDLGGGVIRDACGVQRLPNGNTVVTSYAGGNGVKLFEVTRDKKLVWSYKDGKRHGIHHFQILTTNGKPIKGTPLK